MIDWARVAILKDEVGEEDFAEITSLFMEEAEEVVCRMESGRSRDWVADYHFLKGSSLNMGFRDLATLCHAAELRAQSGTGEANDASRVIESFRASRRAFDEGGGA